MLEIVLALASAATFGWRRPRWSTAWSGAIPAALVFAWLVLHEGIPGDPIGLDDIAWFLGMSLVAGAAFGSACIVGIAARRSSRARGPHLSR